MTEQKAAAPIDLAEFAAVMTKIGREYYAAVQTFMVSLTEALRPLAEFLRQHPEMLDWEPEPDVSGCHHLCGRTGAHECTGEATTTLTVVRYDGTGHAISMRQGCWEAALDDRVVATLATARRALEAA